MRKVGLVDFSWSRNCREVLWLFVSIVMFSFFVSCESADSLFQKANESINNANYDEAIVLLTKAIKKQPAAQFYQTRANCYYILQQYDSSLEDYSQAINYDKDYYDAYLCNTPFR